MRRNVFFAALLCLLFAVPNVFAWTKPEKRDLIYNGSLQNLVTAGIGDSTNQKFFYRNPINGEWGTDIPSGKLPGKYIVEWIMIDGNRTEPDKDRPGEIVEVTIKEYDQPQAITDLVYDGSSRLLIDPNHQGTSLNSADKFYFRNPYTLEWGTDIPSQVQPGNYSVEYLLWDSQPDKDLKGYTISNIKIRANADESPSNPAYPDKNNPTMPITASTVPAVPRAQNRPVNPVKPNDDAGNNNSGTTFYPVNNNPVNDGYYPEKENSVIFSTSYSLPATGFPTRISKPLAIQPESIKYEALSMRIQIPSIDVDVELAGVPAVDGSWAVEWLGDRAGLLSGSAMPGDGYAMVAAHNHLNSEEIGPFGLLFGLKENDRIFVNTADGGLEIFSVYANELVEPDDMEKMASIAETAERSLILVTCENETVDGGYLNRRAIFAKPIF